MEKKASPRNGGKVFSGIKIKVVQQICIQGEGGMVAWRKVVMFAGSLGGRVLWGSTTLGKEQSGELQGHGILLPRFHRITVHAHYHQG